MARIILRNVTPQILQAEPLGAVAAAKKELTALAIASANQAEANAIHAAELMIDAINALSIDADPIGSASAAQQNAIAAAQTMINSLTAASVGAIASSEKAQPKGVATLGDDGILTAAQRPATTAPTIQYPQIAGSLWYLGKVIAGSDLRHIINNRTIYYSYYEQEPPALNDEIEFQFYLKAGTYRLDVWGYGNKSQSLQTVFLNGVSVGTMDWYDSPEKPVSIRSINNVTVATDGLQSLRFKTTGKNTLSSALYSSKSMWKMH